MGANLSLRSRAVLLGLLLFVLSPVFLAADIPQGVTPLAQGTFACGARRDFLFTLTAVQRVSVRLATPTGARITLWDRLRGQLGTGGVPGQEDGRIDAILDAGEYRVVIETDTHDAGQGRIAVLPFRELVPAAESGTLLPYAQGQTLGLTLGDLEQRSYWVRVQRDVPFIVEFSGRALADLRLWRDGRELTTWTPRVRQTQFVEGQPVRYLEFNAAVEEGWYLLVCYGGAPLTWTRNATAFPLQLRYGAEYAGVSLNQTVTLPASGSASLLASAAANFFELVSADRSPVTLSVANYSVGSGRIEGASSVTVNQDTDVIYGRLSMRGGNRNTRRWVVVDGAPGDTVQLVFFESQSSYAFPDTTGGERRYWVSTTSASDAADAADATPFLVQNTNQGASLVRSDTIPVGNNAPLVRRINAQYETSFYIHANETGVYRIAENPAFTGRARYAFVSVRDLYSSSTQTPVSGSPDDSFSLTVGDYLLTITPQTPGVLHFALLSGGALATAAPPVVQAAAQRLFAQDPPRPRTDTVWPEVSVRPARGTSFTMYINPRGGVTSGLVIRETPLDLREPLCFVVEAGATVTVPFTLAAESTVDVVGGSFTATLDDGPLSANRRAAAGSHRIAVRNTSQRSAAVLLRTVAYAAPPTVPVIASLEQTYAAMSPERVLSNDYDRGQSRRFLLRITQASFGRLETTGRLATTLNVRTLAQPAVYSATQNGPGRNARVYAYFRPGDYLIEVRADGRSMGRAGLFYRAVRPVEAGLLEADWIGRRTVNADEVLQYAVTLGAAGSYQARSVGLSTAFTVRFEDTNGWPLGTPADRNGETLRLETGSYRLYSYPETIGTRRLTSVRLLPDPSRVVEPSTENPATLRLNESHLHFWEEREGRSPDRYRLELAAPARVSFSVTDGFDYRVFAPDGSQLYRGSRASTDLDLPMGTIAVEVRSIEPNSGVQYSIAALTTWLLPGTSVALRSYPADVVVSLGAAGLADLESYGNVDVRASLYDASETLVAENDDRRNDWNFLVSQPLQPGRYRLRVETVSGSVTSGALTVNMRMRTETTGVELRLPGNRPLSLTDTILAVPVRTEAAPGLVQFAVTGGAPVSLSLYRADRLVAIADGVFYVPLIANTLYTLRLRTEEGRPQTSNLTVRSVASSERSLAAPLSADVTTNALLLRNTGLISFTLAPSNADGLLYSPGEDRPALPLSGFPENTVADQGWLVRTLDRPVGTVATAPVAGLSATEASTLTWLLSDAAQAFRVTAAANRVWLFEARSQGAMVGLGFSPLSSFRRGDYSWTGVDPAESSTLAALLGTGDFVAQVWNARPGSSGRFRVDLSGASYAIAAQAQTWTGVADLVLTIPPRSAVDVRTPAGRETAGLLLEPGTVAFSVRGSAAYDIAGAREANLSAVLRTGDGRILIVNRGDEAVLARVTDPFITYAGGTIAGAFSREESFGDARRYVFAVDGAADGSRIGIRGSYGSALFLGRDGRALTPEAAADSGSLGVFPNRPGELRLFCRPGWLALWTAVVGREDERFAGDRAPGTPRTLGAGLTTLADREENWELTLAEESLVVLDTRAAGVTALYGADRILGLVTGTAAGTDSGIPPDRNLTGLEPGTLAGRRLVLLLPAGRYRVQTRPLGTLRQEGSLRCAILRPLAYTAESAASDYFLGPVDSQAFRVQVVEGGPVGIGLRAGTDLVQARLYDSSFRLLGSGRLFYRRLEAGVYYVVIDGAGSPLTYRPVVVGADGSRADIPPEIISQYTGSGN